MQNCLNTLFCFSSSWILEVNSKKTKIMIFHKHAIKFTDNFYIGKHVIDLVHEYTYLGTRISSNGNFNVSLEYLKDKLFTLYSAYENTHSNLSKLKPSLACQIFKAMISPVLPYSSKIWGVYIPQLKKPT